MKSTFSTNIYCRPSKASKNGKAPLELCVIIDGKRSYIVLPNPVRMEVVSKCLGHSTTRTTAKYYTELSPQSVINEMAVALR